MTPKLMNRLADLERNAAPPSEGKHLAFQVEAPSGTTVGEIIAFLRARGHAIHGGDEVFVMNLGAYRQDSDAPLRDLSPGLTTEEMRTAAPAGGRWPTTWQVDLVWPDRYRLRSELQMGATVNITFAKSPAGVWRFPPEVPTAKPEKQVFDAEFKDKFPDVRLVKVEDVFGGWAKVQEEHLASGGKLDQLYAGH